MGVGGGVQHFRQLAGVLTIGDQMREQRRKAANARQTLTQGRAFAHSFNRGFDFLHGASVADRLGGDAQGFEHRQAAAEQDGEGAGEAAGVGFADQGAEQC